MAVTKNDIPTPKIILPVFSVISLIYLIFDDIITININTLTFKDFVLIGSAHIPSKVSSLAVV